MTRQLNKGRKDEVYIFSQGLNEANLFWHVFAMADGRLELWRVGVAGNVDEDLDVVGRRPSLELGLGLHHDLDPGVRVALDHRLDPDQRLDLHWRDSFRL